MTTILCITLNPAIDVTLQLDILKIGEVNRQQNIECHAAGKGLNVAQVLKDLGHKVIVTGFLGQNNRQIFDQHFATQHFHNQFVYVEGETRQNIKVAEQSGRMTDINGKGFLVSEQHKQQLQQQISQLLEQFEIVVIAGSLPQGFSTFELAELIKWLKSKGKKVVVDTSGSALSAAISAQPWMIKPNTDELAETYLQPAQSYLQQKQLFQSLQIPEIEHIIVSMGELGVNWLGQQQDFHANAPKVTVKSTVGAGDSLLAGMIHGLIQKNSAQETLKTATAIGSHAVTQIGFHIPQNSIIDDLKQQISVTALSE
ncbi:1-phosphofructokinase [Acinetobacter qingfengensis]|uniref:Phosphofructokinase n=1 Tax=Acinetobacter qingfengensis TaxID=1262585 RepID=A0A1E7RB33_9GAMM|nr:1-phosphofructokinase [Acinetobacter qingfengensis]KAA8734799.1 1-phosphofructokinase [Acinetobacter qingfengensis]OEY96427.1 1-phosphofructokinase [Acinetobacter qingfengensis]